MGGFFKRAMSYFGFGNEEEREETEAATPEHNPVSWRAKRVRRIQEEHEQDAAGDLFRSVKVVQSRVHIVEPSSFDDAKLIGDKFKAEIPVILNLTNTERETAKRLLDFASGLAYGLDGAIQRVAERVFLLTPNNVEVSMEEKLRLHQKGLFNQF